MTLNLNTITFIYAAFVLCIGACLGSFLNAVIYRLPLNISIVTPRSFCPSCKKTIPWFSLTPIFGFFLTKGKCFFCKTKISFQYPAVELFTALGTVFLFCHISKTFPLIVSLWLFYTGIVFSVIDFKHRILPNAMTIPGMVVGFVLSCFNPDMGALASCMGIATGFLGLFCVSKLYELIRHRPGMGMGDVKYLGFIGAVLGWDGVLYTVMLASLAGSLFGIALGLYHKRYLSLVIPFGPFLALGACVVSIWKNDLMFFLLR